MADTKYMRGLDKALATFRGLRIEPAKALTKALNKGVEEIAARVRVLAPDDPATGARIADHVKTDLEVVAAAGARGTRGFRSETLSARVFIPNDPAFYARMVEFGTQGGARKITKGPQAGATMNHPGTTAQPFFFVAVNSLKKRSTGRVKRALKAAAADVARYGR